MAFQEIAVFFELTWRLVLKKCYEQATLGRVW